MDNVEIDIVNNAVRGYGISECPSITCNMNSCANGGTCVTEQAGFYCYCPLGFGGISCAMSKSI